LTSVDIVETYISLEIYLKLTCKHVSSHINLILYFNTYMKP